MSTPSHSSPYLSFPSLSRMFLRQNLSGSSLSKLYPSGFRRGIIQVSRLFTKCVTRASLGSSSIPSSIIPSPSLSIPSNKALPNSSTLPPCSPSPSLSTPSIISSFTSPSPSLSMGPSS